MKKTYIYPETTIVIMDFEGICQVGSPYGISPTLTNGLPEEEQTTSIPENEFAGSYRTKLWED